jgi:hypothetical protein
VLLLLLQQVLVQHYHHLVGRSRLPGRVARLLLLLLPALHCVQYLLLLLMDHQLHKVCLLMAVFLQRLHLQQALQAPAQHPYCCHQHQQKHQQQQLSRHLAACAA